jgi:3-hydroxyacyl-[acyl-carrier-protein] dehydratase
MAEATQTFSVPPEHPVFAGHFPGRPIVPGVLLLEWVLSEIARSTGRATHRLRLREVKFFTPLGPGEHAQLRLEMTTDTRCSFDIRRDPAAVARGVVEWDADA